MTRRTEGTSIGHIGSIVFDEHNSRAKGLLDKPFFTTQALLDSLNMQLGQLFRYNGNITRITARAFIGGSLTIDDLRKELERYNIFPGIPIDIDAQLEITPNESGVNSLVYLGGNSPSRQRSTEITGEDERLLQVAQSLAYKPPEPLPDGYSTHLTINGLGITPTDVLDIFRIYSEVFQDYVTDITIDSVREMIINNTIGLVRDNKGRVVSLTVAEAITNIINGISLVEFTDSATDPNLHQNDHKAKNVNHWARNTLMEYYKDTLSGISLIYSEARADLIPVLRNNFWSGFKVAGLLPNSCKMASPITSSKLDRGLYGDLIVMYSEIKK